MDYTEYPHLASIGNADCRGVTGSGPVGAQMLCGGSPLDLRIKPQDVRIDSSMV